MAPVWLYWPFRAFMFFWASYGLSMFFLRRFGRFHFLAGQRASAYCIGCASLEDFHCARCHGDSRASRPEDKP